MCEWGNLSVAYTPQSYVNSILLTFVFFLGTIGAIIGYVLSKKVRGKHMAIGSTVYWTISLINLYFATFYIHDRIMCTVNALILFSMFLVPFLNVAYIVGKYGHKLARLRTLKLKKKYLMLILASFIILTIVLSVSAVFLWVNSLNAYPRVKEVEIFNDETMTVTFGSTSYFFELIFFEEYDTRFEMSVRRFDDYGFRQKVVRLGKTTQFYDLEVTLNETFKDSVVVRIEKVEE